MPDRLDVTGSLTDGRNTLELEVTNLWPSRHIGTLQPSATAQFAHTNVRAYTKDSSLLPLDILKPATLQAGSVMRC